ncbi:hypothetical protein MSIBF_A2710008 [groundwater metagenome]|uniref:Uncharacterized protein n=1 Tax=groundwater metagenome TaxID=717931 RepID=A0A098ECP9_9ZZZZ
MLILPGLGTAAHGEKRRGLTQIAGFMLFIIIALIFPTIEYEFMIKVFAVVGSFIVFLVWIWALLDGVAFVQNREFYVFENLK